MPDSTSPADWYAKVKEQLGSADTLFDPYPVQSLVHIQQAAEMLFKGKLLELGHNPGRIHSVESLQKSLLAHGANFTALTDPALLDTSYFDARYPVTGYVQPSLAEISLALLEVRQAAKELASAFFP